MMLERSRMHVIVADSSKIGKISSFQFGSTDEVDLLVTDSGVTDEQVEQLKENGVSEVIRVGLGPSPMRLVEEEKRPLEP